MRFVHQQRPDRRVRLAYCLNLHACEDFEAMLAGIEGITLPLRDRLVEPGESFGVGLYLPAPICLQPGMRRGGAQLERLAKLVRAERLDPFTYNAFPFGNFQRAGLKRRVFEPTWADESRLDFTLAVAAAARALASAASGGGEPSGHVSISTHTGRFGPWAPGEEERAFHHLLWAASVLEEVEREGGPRIVLSLEPEPRANAGDAHAVARLHAALREAALGGSASAAVRRHVGTCLDACHSAVEFEEPGEAYEQATAHGTPLGKLQHSSALALARPADRPGARAQLLRMAEERFLHQVTGRSAQGLERSDDLPELAAALESDPARWFACAEWRCHFHVPVDLERLGEEGLATTRAHSEALLDLALARPERWGGDELHLEIETYTWDVLPGAARGAGALVDGLEREYRRVLALLAARGWRRAGPPAN